MKLLYIALCASLVVCSTSAAWAQYGLYGSPEMLRVPQQQNSVQNSAVQAGYPTVPAAVVQPQPAQTYRQPQPQTYHQPQPRYGNSPQPARAYRQPRPTQAYRHPQPQPQYGYPPQRQTTSAYQPYQPGAQYRYAGPSMRKPVRTAAVEQPTPVQPIPAPPAAPAGPSFNTAPQDTNMVNQMLAEQNGYGCDQGCGSCGPYRSTLDQFEQDACGTWDDGYRSPWFGSISALIMGRSDSRRLWTSYATGSEFNQLENTQFGMRWRWGGEVRFGRRFCCNCVPFALEATYWGTESFTGYRSTTNPNSPYTVSTPLRIGEVWFNNTSAMYWFDGAAEHRLWRRNEFHNVEVNVIREQLAWTCDSPWDIGWSAGVRYFRFQEALKFGSLAGGHTWGQSGGLYEAYLSDNIDNNLVGVQVGFDAAYNLANGLRLFISPKFGVYDNYINQTFRAYLGDGTVATTGTSGVPGTYPVHSSKNVLSFLTQIDVGVDWQFARNWGFRAGYRVVAATGMGLADDQFPQYIVDIPEIADIDHCSSLVLHGAFAGLTYNY